MNIYGIIILCALLYFAAFGTCFFIASGLYKPKLMKVFLGILTFGIATIIIYFRNKILLKKYPYVRADFYNKFKLTMKEQEVYAIVTHFYVFSEEIAVIDGTTRYSQKVYDTIKEHSLNKYLIKIEEINDKLL